MPRPSHYLYSWPLNKKKQLVVAISKSFVKQLLLRPMKEESALIKILFTIILIVSRKGTLVYRFSTSYEVIFKLSAWKLLESNSETKEDEFFTEYSFLGKSDSKETINLATL